jgi:hypothetical protein
VVPIGKWNFTRLVILSDWHPYFNVLTFLSEDDCVYIHNVYSFISGCRAVKESVRILEQIKNKWLSNNKKLNLSIIQSLQVERIIELNSKLSEGGLSDVYNASYLDANN